MVLGIGTRRNCHLPHMGNDTSHGMELVGLLLLVGH